RVTIDGVRLPDEAEPFRQFHRRRISQVDDRRNRNGTDCRIEPLKRGLRCFRGEPLALSVRAEDPPHFRLSGNRWVHVALEIEETNVTDGLPIGETLTRPEPNSQH